MIKASEAVQIRGNMYTLMTLALHSTDYAAVARALHARIRQAPGFLSNTPVIVDFSAVGVPANYNFNLLFKVVRQQHLLPVAVRGLPEHMKDALQSAGVPVVELSVPRADHAASEASLAEPEVTVGAPGETLVIPRSLRPGERCYSRGADLIVVGDCQADNELVADGHLHIYGALRGHAVCGFQGNREAQIFCRELDACSVSVAGVGTSGTHSLPPGDGVIQIRLVADTLRIQYQAPP